MKKQPLPFSFWLLALIVTLPSLSSAQKPIKSDDLVPTTAHDLEQICKSFQLVGLEVELHKPMANEEVIRGAACINYIDGVMATLLSMDVGYFPELRFEWADLKKPISHRNMVKPFMEYIAAHPEQDKETAAAVVIAAFMESGLVVPKHWEDTRTKEVKEKEEKQ